MNLEEMKAFLEAHGIKILNPKTEDFDRNIFFEVYGVSFRIEWFVNMSTLYIGKGLNRGSQIIFKFLFLDRTYPVAQGNYSIGFSYEKLKKESRWDREYPVHVFRIPLELGDNNLPIKQA